MDISDALQLVGLFVTISVIGWGVVRWLVSRIDGVHEMAEGQRQSFSRDIAHLHNRVDEVKDTYVKRSELDRDFKAMERRLESVERSIAESRSETNQRLDRMLMLLGKILNNKHPGLDD